MVVVPQGRAEPVPALTAHAPRLAAGACAPRRPDAPLGWVPLQPPDRAAALQLRYDRIDYPIKENRAQMLAAIRQRTSALTGEASLPPMPRVLGHQLSRSGRGFVKAAVARRDCCHAIMPHAPRPCWHVFGLTCPEGGQAGPCVSDPQSLQSLARKGGSLAGMSASVPLEGPVGAARESAGQASSPDRVPMPAAAVASRPGSSS